MSILSAYLVFFCIIHLPSNQENFSSVIDFLIISAHQISFQYLTNPTHPCCSMIPDCTENDLTCNLFLHMTNFIFDVLGHASVGFSLSS